MLRKLLKHEWKSVSKVLFPANLGIILLTIIGSIILSADMFHTEKSMPLALLLIIFYTLSLMTFACITLIYVYVRFYKNLFTSEGYLLHTLPVTRTQLFHSKLFVGYFWCSLNTLLTMLSTAALGFTAGVHAATTDNLNSMQRFLMDSSLANNAEETAANIVFSDIFGYSPMIFVILLLLMMLANCLSSVLMGYLSILLGQLVEKYRLAATIGFYMAIYLITRTITSLVMLVPNMQLLIYDNAEFSANFFRSLLPTGIISQLFLVLVFYIASLFLMRRNVNLE